MQAPGLNGLLMEEECGNGGVLGPSESEPRQLAWRHKEGDGA